MTGAGNTGAAAAAAASLPEIIALYKADIDFFGI